MQLYSSLFPQNNDSVINILFFLSFQNCFSPRKTRTFHSLAPLNFDFASVLGLAMRYASQISQVDFQLANQRTEGVANCVVVP